MYGCSCFILTLGAGFLCLRCWGWRRLPVSELVRGGSQPPVLRGELQRRDARWLEGWEGISARPNIGACKVADPSWWRVRAPLQRCQITFESQNHRFFNAFESFAVYDTLLVVWDPTLQLEEMREFLQIGCKAALANVDNGIFKSKRSMCHAWVGTGPEFSKRFGEAKGRFNRLQGTGAGLGGILTCTLSRRFISFKAKLFAHIVVIARGKSMSLNLDSFDPSFTYTSRISNATV